MARNVSQFFSSSIEVNRFSTLVESCRLKHQDNIVWCVQEQEGLLFCQESGDVVREYLSRFDYDSLVLEGLKSDLECIVVRGKHIGKLVSSLLFKAKQCVEVYSFDLASQTFTVAAKGSAGSRAQLDKLFGEEAATDLIKTQMAVIVKADGTTGIFWLGQDQAQLATFRDGADGYLLETVVEAASPDLCYICSTSRKTKEMILQKGIPVEEKKESKMPFADAVQKLSSLVDFSSLSLSVLEEDDSLAIEAGLLLPEGQERSKVTASNMDLAGIMRVSQTTLEGLHIFGKRSLFAVLNHTRTAGGERMLKTWLRQPMIRVDDIKRRQDRVESFVENSKARKLLHETVLRKIPDVEKLSQRLERKKISLSDMYKLYCAVKEAQTICKIIEDEFSNSLSLKGEVLEHLQSCLPNLKNFELLCEKTLDPQGIKEGLFRVNPKFDDTLSKLQDQIHEIKSQLNVAHQDEALRLKVDQKLLKLESNSQVGFYLRVTLKDERLLRQQKGLTLLDSNKTGLKFHTPRIQVLNEKYLDYMSQYEMQQQYIVDEVLQISIGYASFLSKMSSHLSHVDCLVSLAKAVECAPYALVKPTITTKQRYINLKQARHPIIEAMPGINFIPNDLLLSDESSFAIITGPNLGKCSQILSCSLSIF